MEGGPCGLLKASWLALLPGGTVVDQTPRSWQVPQLVPSTMVDVLILCTMLSGHAKTNQQCFKTKNFTCKQCNEATCQIPAVLASQY